MLAKRSFAQILKFYYDNDEERAQLDAFATSGEAYKDTPCLIFDLRQNRGGSDAYLLKHYDGNEQLAFAAYNAGMGNVDRWIKEGTIKENGSDLENIPFKETNNYVRKVVRNYKIYKKLYK